MAFLILGLETSGHLQTQAHKFQYKSGFRSRLVILSSTDTCQLHLCPKHSMLCLKTLSSHA